MHCGISSGVPGCTVQACAVSIYVPRWAVSDVLTSLSTTRRTVKFICR